jgi:hypothetical protein
MYSCWCYLPNDNRHSTRKESNDVLFLRQQDAEPFERCQSQEQSVLQRLGSVGHRQSDICRHSVHDSQVERKDYTTASVSLHSSALHKKSV